MLADQSVESFLDPAILNFQIKIYTQDILALAALTLTILLSNFMLMQY